MSEIDGYILAGGASSRMGQPKATLLLGGKTFVERAALVLAGISPKRLFVIGNLSETPNGLPNLPDKFVGQSDNQKRGSLIGLHAALANTKVGWAALLACDLPFVSEELLKKLVSFDRKGFDAVVPIQPDARPQQLCALYRSDACLPIIETMLDGDDWSLQKLLQSVKTYFVPFNLFSDLKHADRFFFNVNTPEDFLKAEAMENE